MSKSAARRCAYTLIEVLLTLALVAIVSGVAWTAMQRPLARQRLLAAVDAVRTQWCEARIDAMKSGHTFVFRYMVHGNRYRIAPQDDLSAADSASAAGTDDEDLDDDALPPPIDKTLPQGVCFLSAGGQNELAAMGDEPQANPADNGGQWSDPIYFYADGSTSDAQLLLAADRHCAMRLALRGVTGTATADDATGGTP